MTRSRLVFALLASVTSLVVLSLGVATPLVSSIGPALAGSDAGPKYICTTDKIGADEPGKCPICKHEMVKAGAYVCPACDTTSDKPGKCPCGKEYVKAEMAAHKCGGCGYWISNEVKGCPVCKARQEGK